MGMSNAGGSSVATRTFTSLAGMRVRAMGGVARGSHAGEARYATWARGGTTSANQWR